MLIERVRAVQEARHRDAVLGPALFGDGAEVRLVGERHVREQHVEVALGYRDVARLAGDEPGMVQWRQRVGEFDEALEVGERAVAPTALEVAHEGRAIDGCKDLMRSADAHAARRVAGALGEFGRCGRQQLADEPPIRAHPCVGHVGAERTPPCERIRCFPKFHAGGLEQVKGLVLDPLECLVVEKRVVRNAPGHISRTTLNRGWRNSVPCTRPSICVWRRSIKMWRLPLRRRASPSDEVMAHGQVIKAPS